MAGDAEREKKLLEAFVGVAAKRWLSQGLDAPSQYEDKLRQIKQAAMDTVTGRASGVGARGPYTQGHSKKVSRLAAQIAMQMQLSEAEIEEIRLAGLVHDIGMIHMPDSVLRKPAPLTAEEYEVMKTHAVWGAKLLEPLKVKSIESIVRHHHERYDGKGYPDHLKGEGIPLGARIVAVAESFHAMVSDRPDNSAGTFEDALAELRRCSGTQFDPKVVTAFLDWVQLHGDPREQS